MKMKCMKSTEYGISCLSRGTLFLFLLTVFVLQSVTLLAQNDRTIRGTVIDENEELLLVQRLLLSVPTVLLLQIWTVLLN